MKAANLKIEYLKNPLGVNISNPRFSWELKTSKRNSFQTAYRIVVADGEAADCGVVWDSGKIESDKCIAVEYEGAPLKADTKYVWNVTVWDNYGNNSQSNETAFFVTGLFDNHFEADWITPQSDNINECETSPMLRKEFFAREVKRATLYIYSYGFHYVYLNGVKADNRVLSSPWSDTKKIQLCDIYDVTDKIVNGKNAIGIILGDGYNCDFSEFSAKWNGPKRIIMQMQLHYEDGSIQKIYSDSSWKCSYDSPIVLNSIYNGECYDARNEAEGWSEANFDDSAWDGVRVVNESKDRLHIEPFIPIRITQQIKAKKFYKLQSGRMIIDFGQNFSGFVKLTGKSRRGCRLTLRYAEEIKKHIVKGQTVVSLDTTTNRLAKATDIYIFKDDKTAEYTPHFTYHGFRYVEIVNSGASFDLDDIVGCVVHTDFETVGTFKSDNRLINKIYNNSVWSVRSNSMSYPTDCPSRDERTPCGMDVAAYEDMAAFCFDLQFYYSRWLNHIKSDLKKKKSRIMPCWSGNQVMLAWLLYYNYGDEKSLRDSYPSVKRFIDDCIYYNPEMNFSNGFGDWCAPNEKGDYEGSFSCTSEIDTALFYLYLKTASRIANVLGKKYDQNKYLKLAEKCKETYNELFFDRKKHYYSNGAQAPNILALQFGMVPEYEKDRVVKNLVNIIKIADKGHINTGIFGTRYFMDVLGDIEEIDLAVDCFSNKTYPGFGHQISMNATTLWEQWRYDGTMNSHNHAMFAGATTGFFSKLAGISPLDIAYKKIKIKPCVPESIGKLKCSYRTMYGMLNIEWQKKKDKLFLKVTIPANCTATVIMPDDRKFEVGNGNYCFEGFCKGKRLEMKLSAV